ncbi:UNVERIFIED_CONTAM: Equilibrative nucleotide transporter 1 [Sesamum calycinum]|uniref:Equilibrative nucleotide transporter 1 n=1 Tax=Sesamum calycinum TaxID=2727403 RepID=A0AAW2PPZ8_9LAMI
MGITTAAAADGDSESATLLIPKAANPDKIPKDSFHLAYVIYFTLGAGYLLPWNAFITAVDYFTYLYPDVSVDRVFAIVYMLVGLTSLLFIVAFAHKSNSFVRINVGYVLFLLAIVAVPLMDLWYVKGRVGVYGGYYVTVGLVGLCGVADGLVQGGVVGNAGELPERYMQAVVAGTAASGVLVSVLRVLTKAIYPQDTSGLRRSANLYFIVSVVVMLLNIVFYNVAHRLPVIKYYNDLKSLAVNEEKEQKGELTGKLWRSTLLEIVGAVKWYGAGISIIYVVTLSIFPGSVTEDVHSDTLKDWYPIILIAGYNVFDLIGKSLTSVSYGECQSCYWRLLWKVVVSTSFLWLLARSRLLQNGDSSYSLDLSPRSYKRVLYLCFNGFGSQDCPVTTCRDCRNCARVVLSRWSSNWFCCILVLGLITIGELVHPNTFLGSDISLSEIVQDWPSK